MTNESDQRDQREQGYERMSERQKSCYSINGMVTQTHFDVEQLIAIKIIYFWVCWLQRQSQDWVERKITCRRPIRPTVCMSVTVCVEIVWISLISLFLDLAREVLCEHVPCLVYHGEFPQPCLLNFCFPSRGTPQESIHDHDSFHRLECIALNLYSLNRHHMP